MRMSGPFRPGALSDFLLLCVFGDGRYHFFALSLRPPRIVAPFLPFFVWRDGVALHYAANASSSLVEMRFTAAGLSWSTTHAHACYDLLLHFHYTYRFLSFSFCFLWIIIASYPHAFFMPGFQYPPLPCPFFLLGLIMLYLSFPFTFPFLSSLRRCILRDVRIDRQTDRRLFLPPRRVHQIH